MEHTHHIRPNDWSEDEVEVAIEQPKAMDIAPKKFNMHCKNFFLTFPQCATTKEVALDRLKEKFPPGKFLVCHEEHQTGDPHLHVLIQLEQKLHISNSNYWDFVGGQHGKYEPARNIRKAVEYITKKETTFPMAYLSTLF